MKIDCKLDRSPNVNHDDVLAYFFEQYANSPEPISVDFRSLVSASPYGERGATHLIHTYPAKLLMHIPHFFISSNLLSRPSDLVLDPFCGSGTVLLESILSGRDAIGADSNPLARLIARVKTTCVEASKLKAGLAELLLKIPLTVSTPLPNVVNIDYWFHEKVITQLHRILEAINEVNDEEIKNFFLVCFSNCIKKVSLADLNVSVPVRLKVGHYPEDHRLHKQGVARLEKLKNIDVIQEFTKIANENIKRNSHLSDAFPVNCRVHNVFSDSRELFCDKINFKQPNNSVQLIVTSPPYAGAQKYIRSSSLSLGWLGLCDDSSLREFEKLNIGREHYAKHEYSQLHTSGLDEADRLLQDIFKENPLRSHIAANYLTEMRTAFTEMVRVLKSGGYLVLVVANNQVCGREFKTQEYLKAIVESLGLTLKLRLIDDIHSRGLMTKRNKTASLISCEWVLVFQKPEV